MATMNSIHYEQAGPEGGPVVLCVHGYLMGGDLWAGLGDRLAAKGIRTVMPTWPLGAHRTPLPGVDLTPRGMAALIARFMDALDLRDVTLLGNDSGGAISQVVAAEHPERLGALVLTNCDLFENFPPKSFKPLVAAAKLPGGLRAALTPMRSARLRRSSRGYGALSHGDVDHLAREWVRPVFEDPAILDDLRRFTVAIDAGVTLDAAAKLTGFDRPALLAWAADDTLFPIEGARRMQAVLPDARLEVIEHSRAFSMLDQPDRLAELVGSVVRVAA